MKTKHLASFLGLALTLGLTGCAPVATIPSEKTEPPAFAGFSHNAPIGLNWAEGSLVYLETAGMTFDPTQRAALVDRFAKLTAIEADEVTQDLMRSFVSERIAKLRAGRRAADIAAEWGAPDDRKIDDGVGGRFEIWSYHLKINGPTLYFLNNTLVRWSYSRLEWPK